MIIDDVVLLVVVVLVPGTMYYSSVNPVLQEPSYGTSHRLLYGYASCGVYYYLSLS